MRFSLDSSGNDGPAPSSLRTSLIAGLSGRRTLPSVPEIILDQDDVVVAQVVASLELDDLEGINRRNVFHVVWDCAGYINRLTATERATITIDRDTRRATGDHPVLVSVAVPLLGETFKGFYVQAYRPEARS